MDRRKELLHVLRHSQRPADFIDDGQLGDALLALVEQPRSVAHGNRDLIGQTAEQAHFVRRDARAFGAPITDLQQPDRFSAQPQRHKSAHQCGVALAIVDLAIEAIVPAVDDFDLTFVQDVQQDVVLQLLERACQTLELLPLSQSAQCGNRAGLFVHQIQGHCA